MYGTMTRSASIVTMTESNFESQVQRPEILIQEENNETIVTQVHSNRISPSHTLNHSSQKGSPLSPLSHYSHSQISQNTQNNQNIQNIQISFPVNSLNDDELYHLNHHNSYNNGNIDNISNNGERLPSSTSTQSSSPSSPFTLLSNGIAHSGISNVKLHDLTPSPFQFPVQSPIHSSSQTSTNAILAQNNIQNFNNTQNGSQKNSSLFDFQNFSEVFCSNETTLRNSDLVKIINELNFNAFDYNYSDLRLCVKLFFENIIVPHFPKFSIEKLETLILRTQAVYQQVPYHSFRHSVDVTQFVYFCLLNEEVKKVLTPLDSFCVLTAALLHDLAHCGLNNIILFEMEHDLTKTYKNSPLEEYHVDLAKKLLSHSDSNIIDFLSSENQLYFTNCLKEIILATDMKHHFTIKAEMDKFISRGLSSSGFEDRLIVMKLILKCADLSNVSRQFSTACEWAKRVVEEFLVIGDLQKEIYSQQTQKGLTPPEVQKIFDRERINFPESQVGFIKFIALGQFSILSTAFPSLKYIEERVASNASIWEEHLHNKDEKLSSFENHLRTLGSVIRDPIDTVLDKSKTAMKPLSELKEELIDVETSLVQRKLREVVNS